MRAVVVAIAGSVMLFLVVVRIQRQSERELESIRVCLCCRCCCCESVRAVPLPRPSNADEKIKVPDVAALLHLSMRLPGLFDAGTRQTLLSNVLSEVQRFTDLEHSYQACTIVKECIVLFV